MKILTISCFCIVAAVLCKMLEKDSREFRVVLVFSAVTVVFVCCIASLSGIVKTIEDMFSQANISDEYMNIVFKGIGICYIVQLASDYCKDCGENAIATQVVLAGKLSILVIALPLFRSLSDIVEKLLK